LLKVSGSYWAACTLHAGVELDYFSVIGDARMTSTQIAEKLRADPRAVKMLLNALEPEGIVAIHEFVLDNTMDRLFYPALFSLNTLLGTDQGQTFSELQITAMLAENDVGDIRRLPLGGPTDPSILVGKKLVRV